MACDRLMHGKSVRKTLHSSSSSSSTSASTKAHDRKQRVPGFKKFDLQASLKRKPSWAMKTGKIDKGSDLMQDRSKDRPKISSIRGRKPLGAKPSNIAASSSTKGVSRPAMQTSAAAMASALGN